MGDNPGFKALNLKWLIQKRKITLTTNDIIGRGERI